MSNRVDELKKELDEERKKRQQLEKLLFSENENENKNKENENENKDESREQGP